MTVTQHINKPVGYIITGDIIIIFQSKVLFLINTEFFQFINFDTCGKGIDDSLIL